MSRKPADHETGIRRHPGDGGSALKAKRVSNSPAFLAFRVDSSPRLMPTGETGIQVPISRKERVESPGPRPVVVEVAGRGRCHTDLGFFYDGVPTRHPFPLTLGHELSGTAGEAGSRRPCSPSVAVGFTRPE